MSCRHIPVFTMQTDLGSIHQGTPLIHVELEQLIIKKKKTSLTKSFGQERNPLTRVQA